MTKFPPRTNFPNCTGVVVEERCFPSSKLVLCTQQSHALNLRYMMRQSSAMGRDSAAGADPRLRMWDGLKVNCRLKFGPVQESVLSNHRCRPSTNVLITSVQACLQRD